MRLPLLNTDPASLPLREIHLPDSVGWWPPAPGWWLLPVLLLLGLAAAWYARHLYRRRKFSAVNMARKELAGIRSRYAADRDAGHCVRSVSGLLRRVSISVFPRAESAGLTGADWLAFLQSGNSQQVTANREPTLARPRLTTCRGRHTGQGLSGIQSQGGESDPEQFLEDREQFAEGAIPENIGRLLLEAPYRPQVAYEEVESLIGFCSDWIDAIARISHQEMRPRLSFVRQRARAHSTRASAMLSLAGTRWRTKSGAIIASPGKKSGLARSKP